MSAGPSDGEIGELMAAAVEFAREAGRATLRHFGDRVEAEAKGDGSPVTVADREAEQLLRTRIARRFPGHGILGEEFGEEEGDGRIRWIVDPIDGTRSFMRGVPLYGVLVGIERDGEAVVGVAHFPALAETVWAGRGEGAFWRPAGSRIEVPAMVNGTAELAGAVVLTSDPARSAFGDRWGGWSRLTGAADYTRSWGDAYGHALVATGRAELMVDPQLSAWDAAPLLTILDEAGGRFSSLEGEASIHGGSGLSSNGRLHDAALELLVATGGD